MLGRRNLLTLPLLLAGCIPHATPPAGYGGRGQPAIASDPAVRAGALRACVARLAARGAQATPLPDRQFANGCSALGAVKLVAIGIPVTNLGALTCGLAEPFTAWVQEAVPLAAQARFNRRVIRIESLGSFACRPINNQAGNRLSEHGRANAVDVGAFVLADGRRITVADGWNGDDPAVRGFLRDLHAAACRRFAVVLGPDANALHHDHFHFDMGSGRLCR